MLRSIVILLLAVGSILVSIPIGHSQATRTQSAYALTVGLANVKPTINGVWKSGEWDDAVEVKLAYNTHQVNNLGQAYLRLKYDNTSLYLLFDVPSDTGKTLPPGHQQFALASFDTNDDGWTTSDSGNDFILTFSVNGTGLALGWYPGQPMSYIVDRITASQQLGPSPHSSTSHRIYEVAIPVLPLFFSAATYPPTIGFDACAQDANGNVLCLVNPGVNLAGLTFGSVVVPENIDPILPVIGAVAALSILERKRNRKRIG